MAIYKSGVPPVIGSAKGGGVRKYSPREDERHRERYQPDPKEKKDGEKKDAPKDSFSKLFTAQIQAPEKTEVTGNMTAFTFRPNLVQPPASSYIRARILASTLALELANMKIAE